MNELATARFARQVGFGLGPDEATPADAVGWASGQLDSAPKVKFLASRAGDELPLPPEVRLLESQEEVAHALQRHIDSRLAVLAASRTMPKPQWEALRFQTMQPFLNLTGWQEGLARGCMAVNGPAPVFERFWHFWTNHFTVAPSVNNNSHTAVGPYMRMLRRHMTGSFRDMLFEAVTHPAMVLYLDNARSTGANSIARRSRATTDEINENLGRELLELFTISTAAGYSQQDVDAVTHILTGWGVQLPNRAARPGIPLGSYFNYDRHEPGTQTFMGKSYSAVIRHDGKLNDLIDDLASNNASSPNERVQEPVKDDENSVIRFYVTGACQNTIGEHLARRQLLIYLVAGAGSNRRPWGYESDPAVRTKTHYTQKPNKTLGRGRKKTLMRYMQNQNRYDPRQNLDKTYYRVFD